MTPRRDKPDANKAAIVAELRERGYVWVDTGGSFDGVVIGYNHWTNSTAACLVEVKNPEGRGMRFTKSERELMDLLLSKGYQGVHVVAKSTEDVLRWFGAV